MGSLWWIIPFVVFMLWCVYKFFRGGGPPSDDGNNFTTTPGVDLGGL